MGRTQRVDEKNRLICIPTFMVLKISQMAHFFVFSAHDSEKPVTVWARYLSASKRSHLALLENAMYCWVLSYH